MAVTIAPSVEAAEAIVARINSAETYCLEVSATRQDVLIDLLEEIKELRVDVVHDTETQLNDTLDTEDYSSHDIRIWIRKKLERLTTDETDALKLVTRQIFQRVNDYNTTDRRVQVWECDIEPKEPVVRVQLQQAGLFVVSILLRVEVKPS